MYFMYLLLMYCMHGSNSATCVQAVEVINQLAVELDIHAAIDNVRKVAVQLLECERVTLFLINEPRQELR